MKIEINISDHCKHCKEGLKYFRMLHKRNVRAYGNYILFPLSRLKKEKRDLNETDRIKGLVLSPDYNSAGHLTHFHLNKEK